jgi:hypothetical protein
MKTDTKNKLALNQETLRNLTAESTETEFAPTTTVQTRFVTCTCLA